MKPGPIALAVILNGASSVASTLRQHPDAGLADGILADARESAAAPRLTRYL